MTDSPFPEAHLTRKHIKNIYLRIGRDGMVRISAPMKCPLETINQFLLQKKAWILAHQSRFKKNPDIKTTSPRNSSLQSGEIFMFLGQSYSLKIHEEADLERVIIEESEICCYIKGKGSMEAKVALLKKWQKQQMQALLPSYIQQWESLIGVKVNAWSIKAMKSRWGSCNPLKKHICLNAYLMHKPLACIEYVVVHELVHLLEASHNQRFYALMSQFMPEWKTYKDLLKFS